MTSRRALAALVTGLAALAGSVPTAAAQSPTPAKSPVVSSVVPTPTGLQVRLRIPGLAPGTTLDTSRLTVTLDGRPVVAGVAAQRTSAAGPLRTRSVALVVDTSGSMAGERLSQARKAVEAYLAAVPADVRVGLVTFSAVPTAVAVPSIDRAPVRRAVAGMRAAGDTSLYDAVLLAARLVAGADERRVLVLSDGEDSASTAGLDAALNAVTSGKTGLDAVVLGQAPTAVAALTRLTRAGGGKMLQPGSGGSATSAFATAARLFDTELTLAVSVDADAFGGPTNLTVSLPTSTGAVLSAEHQVLLPTRTPPAAAQTSPGQESRTALLAGLALLFVGLAGTATAALQRNDSPAADRRRVRGLIGSYGNGTQLPASAVLTNGPRMGGGPLVRGALSLADRLTGREALGRQTTSRLERAGLRFTAAEWLVVRLTITLVAATATVLLSGSLVIGALTVAAAVLGTATWLNGKAGRRQSEFVAHMPDSLQLVASGMASGYSLAQSLDSVVREGQEPVAGEFGRALAETRLGVSLEDALDDVAERMESEDFRWVVMAIRVQREVGGNLSEVLQTVCHTMRDRASLRRQVRALSAEGRLSAIVLILMPVLVAVYMSLASPDFFAPMLETGVGRGLLATCALLLTFGALWMKKLVKVEM